MECHGGGRQRSGHVASAVPGTRCGPELGANTLITLKWDKTRNWLQTPNILSRVSWQIAVGTLKQPHYTVTIVHGAVGGSVPDVVYHSMKGHVEKLELITNVLTIHVHLQPSPKVDWQNTWMYANMANRPVAIRPLVTCNARTNPQMHAITYIQQHIKISGTQHQTDTHLNSLTVDVMHYIPAILMLTQISVLTGSWKELKKIQKSVSMEQQP